MSNFDGTLGLYQWFPEHGKHLIYSNVDIERFKALLPKFLEQRSHLPKTAGI